MLIILVAAHENDADVTGPRQRSSVVNSQDPVNGTVVPDQAEGEETMTLEKRVGLFGGISMIVGTMIGTILS